MPQSVLAYLRQKDFRDSDAAKRVIISLYQNDISKYAGRQAPNVTRVFNHIPGALQEHEKRFRPSKVKSGSRMRDFSNAFFWLEESRVANFCYASSEPSIALALCQDDSKLKIYMADTGLLVSMAFSQKALEGGGYEKILRDKLEFNKGMLVENLVAQLLRASGHPLYFYSNSSREKREDTMEIDFLITKEELTSRHNICPIEVKSTHSYRTTSLERCMKKFEPYIGMAYVLHPGDVKMEGGITYLPLYMAGLL
jgi:hypothetical protein